MLILKLFGSNIEGTIDKVYRYNKSGELINMVQYKSHRDSTTYQYTYDRKSGKKKQEIKKEYKITSIIEYKYNSNGDLKKESVYVIPLQDSKKLFNTTEYKYDSQKKLIRSKYTDYTLVLMYEKYLEKDSTNKLPPKSPNFQSFTYSIAYKYDDNNNLIEEYEEKELSSRNNNNVQAHKYFYNDKNLLLKDISYYPNSDRIYRKKLYEYDDKGNLIIEKRFTVGKTERLINIIYFYYNSDKQLIEEIYYDPSGKAREHRKYIYDSSGKIIKELVFPTNKSLIKFVYETY